MRQGIQDFLDVFSATTNLKLGVDGETIEDILQPKLDQELVSKSEFMTWMIECANRIEQASGKILQVQDWLKSMKPINYAGRIIISATDDTEQKVIAKYGGKRWRRLHGFLRGVDATDPQDDMGFGSKFGEEYVCLRESNVPIHVHGSKVQDNGCDGDWLVLNKGGTNTKIVNFNTVQDGGSATVVGTRDLEFQLGPLEYSQKTVAYPHNNMPPHREVYMWECMESTDDEMAASEEPSINHHKVIWNANQGHFQNNDEFRLAFVEHGEMANFPPAPSRDGHAFLGWYDQDGNRLVEKPTILFQSTFIAQWTEAKSLIMFDQNGGVGGIGQISVMVGEKPKLSALPLHQELKFGGYSLNGELWFDKTGQMTKTWDKPVGNYLMVADWTANECVISLDKRGGMGGEDEVVAEYSSPLPTITPPTKQGECFDGYYSQVNGYGKKYYGVDGNGLVAWDVVGDRATLYANWTSTRYQVVFDALGGKLEDGHETLTSTYKYGDLIGTLPWAMPPDTGWGNLELDGWYNDTIGGDKVTEQTPVVEDCTVYARYCGTLYYRRRGNIQLDKETGLATNFSNKNYLIAAKPLDFSQDFDVVVCVTTGSDITTNQKAIGAESNVVEFGVMDGRLKWEISPYEVIMGSACQPNTTYFLKLSARGSHYYCYCKRNEDDEWIADAESNTKPQSGVRMFGFGVDYDNLQHGWESQHWLGTIDMSKSYINVYGYKYSLAPVKDATVHFNSVGGTPKADEIVDVGGTLGSALDGVPTREGYGFNGWWTSSTGGIRATQDMVVEGDMTLYAHWGAGEFTATFDANGGTGGLSKTQNYGTRLVAPTVERFGYAFVEWEPEVPYTMPPGDTTYVAQWNPREYTLTVDPNGGTYGGSEEPTQISPEETGDGNWLTTGQGYFSTIDAVGNDTKKPGHTLLGFYDKRAEGELVYNELGECVAGTYWTEDNPTYSLFKGLPNNEDGMTVYAKWEPNLYNINFIAEEGDPEVQMKQVTFGEPVGELPEAERPGYALVGWESRVPEFQGVRIVPESTYNVAEDSDYYAVWRELDPLCRIHFDSRGGSTVDDILVPRGQAVGRLPLSSKEKPVGLAGQRFDGWWTSPNGGTLVTAETIVPNTYEEVTLYAHWLGIIRYQKVSVNTDQVVNIDENGVASGFSGELSTGKMCALQTIEDDKFDFTGDFTIVMKCERGGGASRQDVFGGNDVPGSNNIFMDFGFTGSSLQWEIAKYRDGGQTFVDSGGQRFTDTRVGEVVYLKVIRTLVGNTSLVRCFGSRDGVNWIEEIDTRNPHWIPGSQGNFATGSFTIGCDSDSFGEFFHGKVYLNDCYLVQENENSQQGNGKYILVDASSMCTVTLRDNIPVTVTYDSNIPQATPDVEEEEGGEDSDGTTDNISNPQE